MTQLHYLGSRGEITPFRNEAWLARGLLPALAELNPARLGCRLLRTSAFAGWGQGVGKASDLFFFSSYFSASCSASSLPFLVGGWENKRHTCIRDEALRRPAGVRARRSITGGQQVQGISTPGLWSVLYLAGTNALFEGFLSEA